MAPKGPQPAAEDAAPPQHQRHGDVGRQQEDQRVEQQEDGVDVAERGLGPGDEVDRRQLRVLGEAQPAEDDGEKADADGGVPVPPARDAVLQHENRGQARQQHGEKRDVDAAREPYALPLSQRAHAHEAEQRVLGRLVARLLEREVLADDVFRRQAVGHVEDGGFERPVAARRVRLDEQAQGPRHRRVETASRCEAEQRLAAQARGAQHLHAGVLELDVVRQGESALALADLDAVEGAGQGEPGAERVVRPARADQHDAVAHFDLRHVDRVPALAEQVLAEAGGGDQAA